MNALEERLAETDGLSNADAAFRDGCEEIANLGGALADALEAGDKSRIAYYVGRLRGRVSALAGRFGMTLAEAMPIADAWMKASGQKGWCRAGMSCARIRAMLLQGAEIRPVASPSSERS